MNKPNSTSKPVHPHTLEQVPGITLREYAAVHILCAILNSPKIKSKTEDKLQGYINGAAEYADLLIEKLQQ